MDEECKHELYLKTKGFMSNTNVYCCKKCPLIRISDEDELMEINKK